MFWFVEWDSHYVKRCIHAKYTQAKPKAYKKRESNLALAIVCPTLPQFVCVLALAARLVERPIVRLLRRLVRRAEHASKQRHSLAGNAKSKRETCFQKNRAKDLNTKSKTSNSHIFKYSKVIQENSIIIDNNRPYTLVESCRRSCSSAERCGTKSAARASRWQLAITL